MVKQYVILYDDVDPNKPIKVLDVKELTNANDFLKFQKLCESNMEEVLERKEQEAQAKEQRLLRIEKRLQDVEMELKLNRGDITLEEYNDYVMGRNN